MARKAAKTRVPVKAATKAKPAKGNVRPRRTPMVVTQFANVTSAANRATWPAAVQCEPILVCGGFLADPDVGLVSHECVCRPNAADAVESQLNLLRQALQLA